MFPAEHIKTLEFCNKSGFFSFITNLNLVKMPIKLLVKNYDKMVIQISLYGNKVCAACFGFTSDKWHRTEIEKQHASLKQILNLNRCTPNIAVHG